MKRILVALTVLAGLAATLEAQGKRDRDRPFIVQEAVYQMPTTLDPHRVLAPGWSRFYCQVYETLLQCDPESDVMTIVPLLADGMPYVSKDARIVRFRLRRGIRFQDDPCFEDGKGREVVANDFVYMIKRHIDPDMRSPFYQAYVAGWFEGVDELRRQAEKQKFFDYDCEVPGVRAVSKYELELRLTTHYPQLLPLLTMPFFALVPHEAVRKYGSGLSEHMVGTGPYLLDKENTDKTKVSFVPNPGYWRKDLRGRALPLNDGIVFHHLDKIELHEQRFSQGDLTLMDLWPQNIEKYLTKQGRVSRSVRPRKCRLVRSDLSEMHFIAFNLKNKILANKKVRQAISLCIDRKWWLDEFHKGTATEAHHCVPPSLPLHAPKSRYRWSLAKQDVKRAKKLLEQAGYPGGAGLPEFVLETGYTGDLAKRELEKLQECLALIDIRSQVREQPLKQLMERINNEQHQIVVSYWFADYPSPENFFLMFLSKNGPEKGTVKDVPNIPGFTNAEYDDLYEKSCKLAPGEKRGLLYERMIRILQDEVPWVFLAHPGRTCLVLDGVKGVVSRSNYQPNLYAHIHRK